MEVRAGRCSCGMFWFWFTFSVVEPAAVPAPAVIHLHLLSNTHHLTPARTSQSFPSHTNTNKLSSRSPNHPNNPNNSRTILNSPTHIPSLKLAKAQLLYKDTRCWAGRERWRTYRTSRRRCIGLVCSGEEGSGLLLCCCCCGWGVAE
ncbi:hypothetical protein PILCRDRAFT_539311 [Piloderma croceum F 1598]|uniref:Secreted protein n=1 Tax=Piloderma croceum (strain F 1598) TaxID=765440 RepID=A0A0C3FK01_PILCF|nr:hypothetical protein PILCRDRAFT_539311 [Piloderma croceum F 1598]